MKLTLKDRLLILKSVLPPFDSRRGIELKKCIAQKIALSSDEEKNIVLTGVGNDQYEVSFKTVDSITQEKVFDITDEELSYLKEKVDFLDRDGRFSDYTLQTYSKIADEPLQEPVEEVVETEEPAEEPVSETNVQPDEETYAH